ncbi:MULTISPECIES: O-antigen ligase family protein [Acinetobacter]|uniref:O-antigen ligase family protein n=1 Tax=Acinetobacter TaxID=469 RepID=UPI0015D12543|nr:MULTISPECIES: O-antigen ligase family protein [Acinetobacter]QOW54222.1 hypothetical protein G0030_14050 [Acinetobacter indicus]
MINDLDKFGINMILLRKITIYKFLIFVIFFSSFFSYFLTNPLSFSLVALGILLFFIIELIKPEKYSKQQWLLVLSFVPFSLIAMLYYIYNPFEGKYFSGYFLTFLLIPILVYICCSNNFNSKEFKFFLSKNIAVFIFLQLLVCLAQVSKFTYGVGLSPSLEYENNFSITGTFYNPNDLALTILLLSCIFISINNEMSKLNIKLIWLMIFIIILLAGSRSAMLLILILYISKNYNSIKNYGYLLILILIFVFFSTYFLNSFSDVGNRVSTRIESISEFYKNGLNSDESIGVRSESYIYFFKNIFNLGLGSGEIKNYNRYANSANFDSLLFNNPHFLIVEIGYWLGWVGILTFIWGVGLIMIINKTNFILFFILLISMMISSSVLGNFLFFTLFFLCIFAHNNLSKEIL